MSNLTSNNWTGIDRTYWFNGRKGLEKAVRELRDDLRAAGLTVVRDAKNLEWDNGTQVALRTEHTTIAVGECAQSAHVKVTIAGYPRDLWAELVALAIRGGFRVETFGPAHHITLTIKANPDSNQVTE